MRYTLEDLKELQKLYVAEKSATTMDFCWENAEDWYISGKNAFIGMTNDFIEWLEARNREDI